MSSFSVAVHIEGMRKTNAGAPSMGRRAIVTSGEQDAYTTWRQVLCYIGRPGVVAKIKRGTHKRERREAQRDIREQQGDQS